MPPPPIPLTTLSTIDVPYGGCLDALPTPVSVWHAINTTGRRCAARVNKCNLAHRLEHSRRGRTCARTARPWDGNPLRLQRRPLENTYNPASCRSAEGLICLSGHLRGEEVCSALGMPSSTAHTNQGLFTTPKITFSQVGTWN